jgi:hypothetical protein
MLHAPHDLTPLDLLLGEVEHGLVRARFVQELDGRADGAAELTVAEIALLAEPDQQDAVGERAAHVVEQQRRAELAFHVTAANDLADVARCSPDR